MCCEPLASQQVCRLILFSLMIGMQSLYFLCGVLFKVSFMSGFCTTPERCVKFKNACCFFAPQLLLGGFVELALMAGLLSPI